MNNIILLSALVSVLASCNKKQTVIETPALTTEILETIPKVG